MTFLHTRAYGGYTSLDSPHAQPWTYEYGFGNKYLIQAQVNQLTSLTSDPLAGDLCYQAPCPNGELPVAPWLAWGPYFWANSPSGPARSSYFAGAGTPQWFGGDMAFDGIHTSARCPFLGIDCGRKKVADEMMSFYTTSPYSTPWLLKH